MAVLGREDILKADDRPTEVVPVPEWGGEVMVRGLDGTSRDEFYATQAVRRGNQIVQDLENATAKLVARCIVDPDTLEPLFTQSDVDALGRKSGHALNRVGDVAARLSGLTDDDMEELGKGSGPTPNDGSTSEPPPPSDAPSPNSSDGSPPSN
jgi:hypothetical protein